MISFEPTEDQAIMRDAVARFAKTTLSPRRRDIEAAREVPDDVRSAAQEMCLGAMVLPEEHGGAGFGMTTAVLLEEELGNADAGACFGIPGAGAFGHAVMELAEDAQLADLLGPFASEEHRFGAVAWSERKPNAERPGFSTLAKKTKSGWALDGTKSFVTHAGLADRFVVFAQVDEAAGWNGIGAFVVMRDQQGVSVGERYDTLGLDAGWFGDVTLADVQLSTSARLGETKDFTLATLRFFAKHALIVAARAVGLSQCAFDLAREYCDTRHAFGKPIGHFQAVAFNLADRLMDVETSRWMLWKAAWSFDSGKGDRACLLASAQAVAHTLEAAMRCADDCVSLHGGMGFVRDVIAEKLMRDAKQLALCCPTPAQLDQLAAAVELGSDLDPALLLPTPETQAIFT